MQSENWSLDNLKECECPICENSFKIGVTYNDNHMCTKCYDKLIEEKEGKEMVKENETIEILDIAGVTFVKEYDYLKVVEEKEKLKIDLNGGKSKMVKTLYSIYEETKNNPEGTWIPKDDYLKVVEEKEKLKIKLDTVTTFRNGYYKEVEELKRENESLHENLDNLDKKLKEMTKHKDKTFLKLLDIEKENEKLEEHINVLISTLESMKDEEEQEYTYTLVYTYWCECDEIEKKYKQTGLLKEEYEEMYGMDSDNWISHTLLKEVR